MGNSKIKCNQSLLLPSEWQKIKERLLYLREKDGSKLMKYADVDVTVKNLVYFSFHNHVVKFYEGNELIGIVAFDISTHWWTNKEILNEVIILCLSDTFKGFGRIAVDKLDEIAKQNKVDIICSGCMFQKEPQMVTNLYLKKGYELRLPTYVKFLKE